MNKFVIPLTLTIVLIFIISFIFCGFFVESLQTILSHATGMITMTLQLMTAITLTSLYLYFKPVNKFTKMFYFMGIASNSLMFIGYFLYIFMAISPSNVALLSHAASSILFDTSTSCDSLCILIALLLLTGGGGKEGGGR